VRGSLVEDELVKCRDIESNLILADKNWKERIDSRNELEEYVYEWRSKMEEGGYDPFVDPSVKQEFLNALNGEQQWLYADEDSGETQSKSVYHERLNSLKTRYSNDIVFRHVEYSSRDQYLERLGKSIQLGQKLLETEEKVDEKKLQKLEQELNDKQKWNDESHGILMNTPLTKNPTITTKVIQEKIDQIEQASRAVMDELHRKKQEKQREEEKRRKEEEEKKKQQQQPAANSGDQEMSAEASADPNAQPMDVDQQSADAN